MLEVSVIVNGAVIVQLKRQMNGSGDLEQLVVDAIAQARKVVGGVLGPFRIDVK